MTPASHRPDEILTTGEAAEYCGVSRSTLRRAVAQGHLRAWHTPGRHLRFTREACEEFARSLGRLDLGGAPAGGLHELRGRPARQGEAAAPGRVRSDS